MSEQQNIFDPLALGKPTLFERDTDGFNILKDCIKRHRRYGEGLNQRLQARGLDGSFQALFHL